MSLAESPRTQLRFGPVTPPALKAPWNERQTGVGTDTENLRQPQAISLGSRSEADLLWADPAANYGPQSQSQKKGKNLTNPFSHSIQGGDLSDTWTQLLEAGRDRTPRTWPQAEWLSLTPQRAAGWLDGRGLG